MTEIWDSILEFVYPPICSGCQNFFETSGGICETCKSKINPIPSPVCLTCDNLIESGANCSNCKEESFPLYTIGTFSSPTRDIILDLKFHSVVTPFEYLSGEISKIHAERIASLNADFLVPVPLHPSREYYRGYNQAFRFANCLSKSLSMTVISDILYRIKKGRPQSKIAEVSDRLKNIEGAFVAEEYEPTGKLILVDDVVTSGATVREAKKTLQAEGYVVAGVISIAFGGLSFILNDRADGLNIYKPQAAPNE